ncbi:MAG: indolepyruvate oxidoreductase subunit beta [Ardenticatenales bacterium]|nr:indolepyruvate oxidoreductase subunit beta [Ardenticatenales bacterium]
MPNATEPTITSVLVSGVGGQGVLLVSEVIARAAIAAGHDATQTEVHGVSQRGGSVHSHVRFGTQVHSPLIPVGQADLVVGMEKLEAVRFAHFLRPGGAIVVNAHEIPPVSAGSDAVSRYPHDAVSVLRSHGLRVIEVPATDLAERELGNGRVANVLVLGLLSTHLPIPVDLWSDLLTKLVPERFLELNRRAFSLGVALGGSLGREPAMRAATQPDSGGVL